VSFLHYLETLRATEGRQCFWLAADSSTKIFEQAERRVYRIQRSVTTKGGPINLSSQGVRVKRQRRAADTAPSVHVQMVLEPNPKWNLLLQVRYQQPDYNHHTFCMMIDDGGC
jgi:hypothetical protein